jgi:antitoxin ParD1/3/4
MNVSLKADIEKFVAEKVNSGQYADVSDLVNEALEVLRDQEEFSPEHEEYLREEVGKGLAQLDSGQLSVFDARTVIAEERARIADGNAKKGIA